MDSVNTKFDYPVLGTLCDEPSCLTCSFSIARQWGKAERIDPYPTYEEAANDVKLGKIDACLVAGAYPKLGFLIFDEDLMVKETFVMRIPSLVLVGIEPKKPAHVKTLFHHPATVPLLPETGVDYDEHEFVTSNSKACTTLLARPDQAIAITNRLCAHHFGLHIYNVLRPGTMMPWLVFTQPDEAAKRATTEIAAMQVA